MRRKAKNVIAQMTTESKASIYSTSTHWYNKKSWYSLDQVCLQFFHIMLDYNNSAVGEKQNIF